MLMALVDSPQMCIPKFPDYERSAGAGGGSAQVSAEVLRSLCGPRGFFAQPAKRPPEMIPATLRR